MHANLANGILPILEIIIIVDRASGRSGSIMENASRPYDPARIIDALIELFSFVKPRRLIVVNISKRPIESWFESEATINDDVNLRGAFATRDRCILHACLRSRFPGVPLVNAPARNYFIKIS